MNEYLDIIIPIALFGVPFAFSYIKEPRRFRNAVLFFFFFTGTIIGIVFHWNPDAIFIVFAITFSALVFVPISMIINTFIVVKREGFSLSHILPAAMAVFTYLLLFLPSDLSDNPNGLQRLWFWIAMTFRLQGTLFLLVYVSLFFYAIFYRLLPRRRSYDYIIIHGAGLIGDQLSPLLLGRVEKAFELWDKQGRKAKLICSGGQGSDEKCSEAEAMHKYLLTLDVPENKILNEDQSTTTRENLRFSKNTMDRDYYAQNHVSSSANAADAAIYFGSCAGSEISEAVFNSTQSRKNEIGESDIKKLKKQLKRRKRREKLNISNTPYRCAVVTSDYHVFRTLMYTREFGIRADGIGSHTKSYYWTTAFIREFIALTKEHPAPYIVIAGLTALNYAICEIWNTISFFRFF